MWNRGGGERERERVVESFLAKGPDHVYVGVKSLFAKFF